MYASPNHPIPIPPPCSPEGKFYWFDKLNLSPIDFPPPPWYGCGMHHNGHAVVAVAQPHICLLCLVWVKSKKSTEKKPAVLSAAGPPQRPTHSKHPKKAHLLTASCSRRPKPPFEREGHQTQRVPTGANCGKINVRYCVRVLVGKHLRPYVCVCVCVCTFFGREFSLFLSLSHFVLEVSWWFWLTYNYNELYTEEMILMLF